MPTLERIVVQDYRNIALQEIAFSPNVNCISGNNGVGKTNLLDAIWCLSMTKGAFGVPDRLNRRHGTEGFTVAGTYRMETGLQARFSLHVGADGSKKLVRDDKPYAKISEHIGVLPVVMVSPSDIALVSESGQERRRFSNAVLSQMDRGYLAAVQQYGRLLLQRNHLLKEGGDDDLLDVLDERMDAAAAPVHAARLRLAEDLRPIVADCYRLLSGGGETVGIGYRSDCTGGSLRDLLRERRDRDRALKYTTAGLQRDDFLFTMDGEPIRRCGSQGQQKSFLVSLKFAQYDIMKRRYGFPPVLLLDDVFDKLDMGRIANLIGLVAGNGFGQIFITDCDKARLQGIVDRITDDRAYFDAAAGVFTRVE